MRTTETIRRLEIENDSSSATQRRLRAQAMRNALAGTITLLRSLRDNLDAQIAQPEDSVLSVTAADLIDYRDRLDRAGDTLHAIGFADMELRRAHQAELTDDLAEDHGEYYDEHGGDVEQGADRTAHAYETDEAGETHCTAHGMIAGACVDGTERE